MCSVHMLLSCTDKLFKPHLHMYEYYLMFVVKNEVSKLQQPLRMSPCILLGYRKQVCLFPINSLNLSSNLYKQRNLHPATR